MTRASFKFDPEWRTTLFTLLLLPALVYLGLWQLQRAGEKTLIADRFAQRQVMPPTPLTELFGRPALELAYRPVTVTGRVLSPVFLLDNRVYRGRFGYEVLSVLEPAAGGPLVLLNRGWIAADPARRELPSVPVLEGPVSLSGHVYVAPGEPYLLAEQQLEAGWPKRIQAVEPALMRAALGGAELFPHPVRLDRGQPGALTVDWKIVNVSPEKHRAYALQWFAMAAALGVFYILRSSNLWQVLAGEEDRQR